MFVFKFAILIMAWFALVFIDGLEWESAFAAASMPVSAIFAYLLLGSNDA